MSDREEQPQPSDSDACLCSKYRGYHTNGIHKDLEALRAENERLRLALDEVAGNVPAKSHAYTLAMRALTDG